MLKQDREFYIPKDAIKLDTINGVDIYQYVTKEHNQLAAVCFLGRAQKPAWRYRFTTAEQMQSRIEDTIDKYQARKTLQLEAKADRKLRKAEASKLVNIGDIFVESFHYESTTVEFWQVVSKHGSKVELNKISKSLVHTDSSGRNEDYMPDIDGFIADKKMTMTISDKVGDTIYLKCQSWYSVTSWSGRPVYQTNIYWR